MTSSAPSARALALFLLGLCIFWFGIEVTRAADAFDLARAGIAAKERRQYLLAIQLIDGALVQGSFTAVQKGILIYNRGVSYDAIGVQDNALNDFDAAIALLPTFPSPYIYRAIILADRGSYERALADLMYASHLAPDDPLILNNIGNAQERLGEHGKAIENYNRAIELKPDYAEAFYNRAAVYLGLDDFERAAADYDAAIRLIPNFASAYGNLGVLELRRGATHKAIADFGMAIRLSPAEPVFLINRANAFLINGNYRDAVVDFDRALTIEPGVPGAYLGRGRAQLYAGEPEKSVEDFATALRLRPHDPNAAIWLHIARWHSGFDDSRELAENVSNVKRDLWPSAVLDFYLGKLDADRIREAAREGPPGNKAARECEAEFYLADALLHGGATARGRHLLEAVVLNCKRHEVVYGAAWGELRLLSQ